MTWTGVYWYLFHVINSNAIAVVSGCLQLTLSWHGMKPSLFNNSMQWLQSYSVQFLTGLLIVTSSDFSISQLPINNSMSSMLVMMVPFCILRSSSGLSLQIPWKDMWLLDGKKFHYHQIQAIQLNRLNIFLLKGWIIDLNEIINSCVCVSFDFSIERNFKFMTVLMNYIVKWIWRKSCIWRFCSYSL